MKQPSTPSRHHQRGAATLMVALILLISLTLLTLYAARVTVSEHQTSANDYRAKQAFEAAQAGIEVAAANQLLNGGGALTRLPTNLTNTALANGATYSATYSRPIAGNLQRILVTSTGRSDDSTAIKVLRQQLQFRPFPINGVNAGIVAMGAVDIGSAAANASNGGAPNSFSVRSGGAITTRSTSNLTGPSLQNDNTIPRDPDKFFKSIFGDSKSAIRSQATQINCTGNDCPAAINSQQNPLIWMTGDGNINGGTTIGTAANPVVLIVDGGFRINGGLTVWGLVYYTETWVNRGGGNATVNGATVVEGNFQSTGNPGFNYNANVLNGLGRNLGSFEKLAGGWRDF